MSEGDRIESRLAEIASYEDGWMDGHGKAVSPVAIEAARSVLRQTPSGCGTFATEEGGVEIEWINSLTYHANVSVEIEEGHPEGMFWLFRMAGNASEDEYSDDIDYVVAYLRRAIQEQS